MESTDTDNQQVLQDIFQNNLKVESSNQAIHSLFDIRNRNRIIPDPYYQRNYVWDNNKASYFIESILLGTEIPPLIFFKNRNGKTEVLDGRQRYETIKRFMNDEFNLTRSGLYVLADYAKKSYSKLPQEVMDLFNDTHLRIIEFSLVRASIDEKLEDIVKKEIFRRYNSGITPLRDAEIENAQYFEDELTVTFKEKLREDSNLLQKYAGLFLPQLSRTTPAAKVIEILKKVRTLFSIQYLPISWFATSKKESIAAFYEVIAESCEPKKVFREFSRRIAVIERFNAIFGMNDRLINEVLFWILSIIENEGTDIEEIPDSLLAKYSELIKGNQSLFDTFQSHFYEKTINRYRFIAEQFKQDFPAIRNIDAMLFAEHSNVREKYQLNSPDTQSNPLQHLESLRTNKPDAASLSINSLVSMMRKRRFLIRPAYQRHEVINLVKSSRIIESILLDIRLPSIFVFKRQNGISEVVDGQQRILTILGFIGEEYLDEESRFAKSNKHNFSLRKPLLIETLAGRKFIELSEQDQEKLLDYKLSVVEIDERLNPKFDPIDLFIRLNNKPYPIKENSFEMWNSYIDKDIISGIKEKVKRYASWFYSDFSNKRMKNEDLYTYLTIFSYHADGYASPTEIFEKLLDIYQKDSAITIRIKDKLFFSRILENASMKEDIKNKILVTLKELESLIKKTELILIKTEVQPKDRQAYLFDALNDLFHVKSNNKRRPFEMFYLLWLLLHRITRSQVLSNRETIREEVSHITSVFKREKQVSETPKPENIRDMIKAFWLKYDTNSREVRLNEAEKREMIIEQENKCPYCNGQLFYGDEIEIDHIIPISKGGKDVVENLQVLHKICNRKKYTS